MFFAWVPCFQNKWSRFDFLFGYPVTGTVDVWEKTTTNRRFVCFVPAKKDLKVWPQIFLGWLIGISLHLSMNYPNFMIFWVQAPCFLNFLLVKSQIIIFVASIPVTLWSSWPRDPFLRRKNTLVCLNDIPLLGLYSDLGKSKENLDLQGMTWAKLQYPLDDLGMDQWYMRWTSNRLCQSQKRPNMNVGTGHYKQYFPVILPLIWHNYAPISQYNIPYFPIVSLWNIPS